MRTTFFGGSSPAKAFSSAVRTALAGAVACLAAAAPASAGPGDMQFATVTTHDPSGFLRAFRAGEDFVKSGKGRKFRVILGGGGAIVAIPGTNVAQRDYMKARGGGVQVIACKETIDALSKANKRRIPVLPGVTVMACAGLRNKMTVSGWQQAPGF